MSERPRPPGVYVSVFVKMMAVMLLMMASLVLMVAAFFWLIGTPNIVTTERLAEELAPVLAATAPDFAEAKRLSARLGVQMRYEGPDGAWATADHLPDAEAVRRAGGRGWRRLDGSGRADYDLAAAPNGGTYVLSWDFHRQMYDAHVKLLWLLLFLMIAVIVAAHAMLRHLLRPLRWLGDGVARLTDGQLDVVLPRRTRDEFGALTEAFNLMARRVAEMIRTRDQLLLDVSHELRSPLTRMKVSLALLAERGQAASMNADVAEMEVMISELLELERFRNGRGMTTTSQDVLPILHEAAERFRDRPPGVRVARPAGPILLDLDADRLLIVLRNVLENAVKYSLPDSRPVEVTVTREDGIVAIRVKDDGPGIPERDVGQLFEPFFRVDRSRSKKTGGYGLGLSICKRIMEAHGGDIVVANNPTRGATFVLTLPARGGVE